MSSASPTRIRRRSRQIRIATAAVLPLVALVALAGCAGSDWDRPHAAPTAVGSLGAGFVPQATPTPEATIEPAPGSWAGVHPSAGYRVVLLTARADAPTRTVVDAVQDWADAEQVDLRTITAEGDPVDAIVEAMEMKPDLIVSTGNDLVDALTLITPSHLTQPFLLLGADLPEPTINVTSVSWTGGAFRGVDLGASSEYDPATFTSERVGDAIRAGVAAVLHGITGYVLRIP